MDQGFKASFKYTKVSSGLEDRDIAGSREAEADRWVSEFKGSLVCRESFRIAKATHTQKKTLSQKQTNKRQKHSKCYEKLKKPFGLQQSGSFLQ